MRPVFLVEPRVPQPGHVSRYGFIAGRDVPSRVPARMSGVWTRVLYHGQEVAHITGSHAPEPHWSIENPSWWVQWADATRVFRTYDACVHFVQSNFERIVKETREWSARS